LPAGLIRAARDGGVIVLDVSFGTIVRKRLCRLVPEGYRSR